MSSRFKGCFRNPGKGEDSGLFSYSCHQSRIILIIMRFYETVFAFCLEKPNLLSAQSFGYVLCILRMEALINGMLTIKVRASAIGMLSQMPNWPMTGVSANKGTNTNTMLRHTAMTTDSTGRSMAVWKLLPMMLMNEIR